jgi:hypothetical protein
MAILSRRYDWDRVGDHYAHGPVGGINSADIAGATVDDIGLHLSDCIPHGDIQRRQALLLVEQRLMLRHQSKRRRGNHAEYRHRQQQLDQSESRHTAASALQK